MKHIVLVVENLPLSRDHRLRKQAAALVDDGYRVSVICRADPENRLVPGVEVHEYRTPADGAGVLGFAREYAWSLAAASWHLARLFARERFDAIQISGTPDIYFAITAPYRRLGVRVVFDQRDLSPELYELRYGRKDVIHRTLLRLERRSYRAADRVITVNRSLERIAYERGDLPVGRVRIVGNGPSLARTRGVRPDPALRGGRRHLCCWVGVMGPQDQVELALRAVADVRRRGRTDTHFAFIGDGESRGPARRLATELGLDEVVSFPGWLPEQQVFTYLAGADLALEPNLEAIVSPVKAMEYMAFGVPFVAFDLAETRRLAGTAGSYVAPADVPGFATAIDSLLDDPHRRSEMGAVGRRRIAEHLCWERQQVAYLDVYRELLGDGGRARRSRPVVAGVA
jgi:glycosyltransferase involved in cell wall biosynthesis